MEKIIIDVQGKDMSLEDINYHLITTLTWSYEMCMIKGLYDKIVEQQAIIHTNPFEQLLKYAQQFAIEHEHTHMNSKEFHDGITVGINRIVRLIQRQSNKQQIQDSIELDKDEKNS